MNKNKKAFTLVELIVVITILAILGTIAFISLQGYSKSSRDSVRISDVSSMKTALELFHLDAGKYPLPDNYEEITYGTDILRYQGIVGKTVLSQLSRSLNKIPTDPLTDKEYIFSVSGNKNEFEILNLLEGDLAYNTKQPLSGIFSPSQEKEATFLVKQTNAAETTRIPRVDGQYNGLFVKTANYIFPTPSIINSEPIIPGAGLVLDATNIKSQVITGGKNIPVIGSVTPKTGELNIALSVYNGTINKESTPEQKINAMKAIQGAYSGSELAGIDAFKVILDKTTDEELIAIADTVILEKTSSTAQVAADKIAPVGGDFTMPAASISTATTLTITCPVDAAGSNPVQMYISGIGLASGGNVWEDCVSSKSITLVDGVGTKNISIKWKDSFENETSVIAKNIDLNLPTVTLPGSVVQDIEYKTNSSSNWTVYTKLSASTNKDTNTIIFNGQFWASGTGTPPSGNLWLNLFKWDGNSRVLAKSYNNIITTFKIYNLSSSYAFSPGTYKVSTYYIDLYFDIAETGQISNASIKNTTTNLEIGTVTINNN